MFEKIRFERLAAMLFVFACVALGVWIGFRFLLPALLPFLLAWAGAFLIRPLACTLQKRIHLPKKVGSPILLLLFLAFFFFVIYLLVSRIMAETKSLLLWLKENPHVFNDFFDRVNGFFDRLRSWLPTFSVPEETGSQVFATQDYVTAFLNRAVSSLLDALPGFVGQALLGMPGILIFILVTIIASVYFSVGLEDINAAVMGMFPEKWQQKIRQLRVGLFLSVWRYLRSYLFLMTCTFLMLLVGFWIIGVKYALLLAALFAVIDLLPILGVGTLLLPWGVFCLATGQGKLGFSLLILYVVIAVIRQFAEPKILGENLGIPPLLMLLYLYGGLSLFGFWGIILGPLIGFLVRALTKTREKPKESG